MLLLYLCVWCICLMCLPLAISQNTNYRKSTDKRKNLFPLTIIHMNDFHARFEETNEFTTTCKKEENQTCIGGYARAINVIKNLKTIRTNPIYLNVGDNFAGTIWYTIGRWNVTSQFLNLYNADAMTLGNHEFDHAIEGVVPFLDLIQAPITLANVDTTNQPGFEGKLKKSIVLIRGGRKIGIIGVINKFTNEIASTGKIIFLDETETVRIEAAKLKEQGVDIIIVLSHCGLDTDYKIAKDAGSEIDIIVGGHSHSFLYTGSHPPGPDTPEDEYPAIVTQSSGHKVLIVQASAYTKYIGDITLYFDSKGKVVKWRGAPIYLGPNIEQDKEILEALKPWKEIFDKLTNKVIGNSNVILDNDECSTGECELGDFLTDAFLQFYYKYNETIENPSELIPTIAILNAGGIRSSLSKGSITYGDISTVLPFGNTVDAFDLTGQHILEIFEYNAKRALNANRNHVHLLQVSGMKVVFNATQPIGERVVSIDVRCLDCADSKYEPLDTLRSYRIITSHFLATGGDGFVVIDENKMNHIIGPIDIDICIDYFKDNNQITIGETERITILY